jgi:hypothetical protein
MPLLCENLRQVDTQIQELTDEDYRRAQAFWGRKDDFF